MALRRKLAACLALGAVAAAPGPPDPAFLRHQWERQAAGGDAQAAYRLGMMYDLGQGIPADAAKALEWYERAGAGGVADAAFNAAVMLDDGQSSGRDRSQAAEWYARAAVHGNARAALNLARMYEAGDGVPRNGAAEAAWLAQAATSIPIARQRLRTLRAQLDAPSSAPTPDAMPPAVQMDPAYIRRPAELVWTAPESAGSKLGYVVSLAVPGTQTWMPVIQRATKLTAMLTPADTPSGCYAWRVYTVLAGGAHYAASPWQRVGCAAT